MDVVAWSQNLTAEKAAKGGAKLVSKDELLKTSDFVSRSISCCRTAPAACWARPTSPR